MDRKEGNEKIRCSCGPRDDCAQCHVKGPGEYVFTNPNSGRAAPGELASSVAEDIEDPAVPSVDIYAEEGKTIFRLCCQDRRGLLGDVANALQRMPLQVKGANIVTSVDHWVCDKFEVVLDANAPPISDLRFNFIDIFKDVAREASMGEKRRRGST